MTLNHQSQTNISTGSLPGAGGAKISPRQLPKEWAPNRVSLIIQTHRSSNAATAFVLCWL